MALLLLWRLLIQVLATARAYRPSGGDALEQAFGSTHFPSSIQTLEVLDSAHVRYAHRDHRRHERQPLGNSSLSSSNSSGHKAGHIHSQGAEPHRGGSAADDGQLLAQRPPMASGVSGAGSSSEKGALKGAGLNTSVFAENLKRKDAKALVWLLRNLSIFLEHDSKAAEIICNSSFVANGSHVPLLAAIAQAGWQRGVAELLDWDKERTDNGSKVNINVAGKSGSPLELALAAGHGGVVHDLIQRGASVDFRGHTGHTPLEMAASQGGKSVVEALLGKGSNLSNGLAPLRRQLAVEAAKLPRLNQRWPFGKERGDGMDEMRRLVPAAFHPSATEEEVVGDQPATWILLYKTRVMCTAASRRPCDNAEAAAVAEALAANGFDSLVRDFSISEVSLVVILGVFCLFTYVGFRIKLYGPPEAPVSLAELLPGAFNPARVLDADFDPSRQKIKLPYRGVKAYLAPQGSSCLFGATAFGKAFLGVFCSWLLQYVRIPPEKDPYDEDYQSDDDEDSRLKVRDQCKEHALRVRNMEVAGRSALFLLVVLWLTLGAGRWHDAAVCVLLYLYYSWFATCVAASAEPAPVPEKVPDETEGNVDAASVVSALFSVQYGPRWTRAVVSTRSTASLRRTSTSSRRRSRKPRPRSQGADAENSGGSGAEGAGGQIWGEAEVASFLEAAATGTPYSDHFQRAFLQSGLLHVKHRSLLERSVLSMLIIAVLLLWLFHLRWIFGGSFYRAYADRTPAQLFWVYGVPGTLGRFLALLLEMGLLWLSAERLYGACSLLHVAGLTLQQRGRALVFAREHGPRQPTQTSDEVPSIKESIQRVDESVRCTEFALELSAVRWNVLAEPVMLVYLCTLKLLAVSLLFFSAIHIKEFSPELTRWGQALDPAVPLGIALCLCAPLLAVLVAAASGNREVAKQRQHLEDVAEDVLAKSSSSDIDHVALRVKAREALQTSVICWPGGRELGFLEPCLIVATLALIVGAAVAGMGLSAGQGMEGGG